jgi:hypothetical protein
MAEDFNISKISVDFSQRLDQFNKLLEKWIGDMQSMEIITGVGNVDVKIDPTKDTIEQLNAGQIKLLARTSIHLDGDLLVLLPKKGNSPDAFELDPQIYAIHKENVNTAIQSFSNNLKIISEQLILILNALRTT